MMKKVFLIILIITTRVLNSQNQEATIYFHDGSSLEGYGMIDNNYKIKFRLSLEDKPDVWTDVMVKGITFRGFDAEIKFEYQYEKFDKSHPLLLEVIEKGNVDLYVDCYTSDIYLPFLDSNSFLLGKASFKNTKYYIKRPKEDLVLRLNNGFYYKYATEYFKDCPSLVEKIKKERYVKSKVLDIVYFYNDWCNNGQKY